jgi:hypothetical protein
MNPRYAMAFFLSLSLAILAACSPGVLEDAATANPILIGSPTALLPPTNVGAPTETASPEAGDPTAVPPTPKMAASFTPLPTATAPEPARPTPGTGFAGSGTGLAAVLVRPENWRPNLGDIALVRADGSGLRQLTEYRYNADPVLSPDGQRIAYRSVPSSITSLAEPGPRLVDGYYNIWVITSDGEQARQLSNSEAVRSIPTWSIDGQRVAFSQGEDGELLEFDVGNGDSRRVGVGIFDPKTRPDGNGFGFLAAEGGLAWLDNEGVRQDIVAATALPAQHQILDFDWRPDGQAVLYTLADLSEQVFDSTLGIKYSVWQATMDGAKPVKLADGARNPRVSPDGRTAAVLTGSGYGDACIVDQGLAFLALEPGANLVDMADLAGYPPETVMGSFYPLANVTWSSGQNALVEFGLTCDEDRGKAGMYLVNSQARQMVQVRPAGPVGSENLETGIAALDAAIATFLSNDVNARRELVQYTTTGCTTAEGLGGPPKCVEGQADGTPVAYFPVLGPGEGSPVLPENIDQSIDVVVGKLFAAVRLGQPAVVDEYYPAGTYGLIFSLPAGPGLSGIHARLDENGRLVRLDYLMGPVEDELAGLGVLEVLLGP